MAVLSITSLQRLLKAALPAGHKQRLLAVLERLQTASLKAAIREQGLWALLEQLKGIVPDLRHQYTSSEIQSEYLCWKVRGMHAFQIALANEAIQAVNEPGRSLTLVDIGDSAGTHIQYLQALHKEKDLRCVSVNLDEAAVRRIRAKGLEAVCARAEDLTATGLAADMYLSFEMLEHLWNPIQVLRNLSERTACRALVISVPYLEQSRMGLHHIRGGRRQLHHPENTHIFELSPADWRLLFAHAGWAVERERLYLQYPRYHPLRFMRGIWRTLDFEGFWGAILRRDKTWSDLYAGGVTRG